MYVVMHSRRYERTRVLLETLVETYTLYQGAIVQL